VYKTAEELMGQLKAWMSSYAEVGNSLKKALGSYTESKKKLIESNQSVVKKIGKLERLGLAPKRSAAKIKTGTRMAPGKASIIPPEFSEENVEDTNE
jgi:DNA anti-recombination protein RmuC